MMDAEVDGGPALLLGVPHNPLLAPQFAATAHDGGGTMTDSAGCHHGADDCQAGQAASSGTPDSQQADLDACPPLPPASEQPACAGSGEPCEAPQEPAGPTAVVLHRGFVKIKRVKLPKKQTLVCKVDGCGAVLAASKAYYQRHKVCSNHLSALCAPVNGVPSRFCQQCGKFQPVHEFDEDKRSCRARLKRHNSRRREQRHNKATGELSAILDLHSAQIAAAAAAAAMAGAAEDDGYSDGCLLQDSYGGVAGAAAAAAAAAGGLYGGGSGGGNSALVQHLSSEEATAALAAAAAAAAVDGGQAMANLLAGWAALDDGSPKLSTDAGGACSDGTVCAQGALAAALAAAVPPTQQLQQQGCGGAATGASPPAAISPTTAAAVLGGAGGGGVDTPTSRRSNGVMRRASAARAREALRHAASSYSEASEFEEGGGCESGEGGGRRCSSPGSHHLQHGGGGGSQRGRAPQQRRGVQKRAAAAAAAAVAAAAAAAARFGEAGAAVTAQLCQLLPPGMQAFVDAHMQQQAGASAAQYQMLQQLPHLGASHLGGMQQHWPPMQHVQDGMVMDAGGWGHPAAGYAAAGDMMQWDQAPAGAYDACDSGEPAAVGAGMAGCGGYDDGAMAQHGVLQQQHHAQQQQQFAAYGVSNAALLGSVEELLDGMQQAAAAAAAAAPGSQQQQHAGGLCYSRTGSPALTNAPPQQPGGPRPPSLLGQSCSSAAGGLDGSCWAAVQHQQGGLPPPGQQPCDDVGGFYLAAACDGLAAPDGTQMAAVPGPGGAFMEQPPHTQPQGGVAAGAYGGCYDALQQQQQFSIEAPAPPCAEHGGNGAMLQHQAAGLGDATCFQHASQGFASAGGDAACGFLPSQGHPQHLPGSRALSPQASAAAAALSAAKTNGMQQQQAAVAPACLTSLQQQLQDGDDDGCKADLLAAAADVAAGEEYLLQAATEAAAAAADGSPAAAAAAAAGGPGSEQQAAEDAAAALSALIEEMTGHPEMSEVLRAELAGLLASAGGQQGQQQPDERPQEQQQQQQAGGAGAQAAAARAGCLPVMPPPALQLPSDDCELPFQDQQQQQRPQAPGAAEPQQAPDEQQQQAHSAMATFEAQLAACDGNKHNQEAVFKAWLDALLPHQQAAAPRAATAAQQQWQQQPHAAQLQQQAGGGDDAALQQHAAPLVSPGGQFGGLLQAEDDFGELLDLLLEGNGSPR